MYLSVFLYNIILQCVCSYGLSCDNVIHVCRVVCERQAPSFWSSI